MKQSIDSYHFLANLVNPKYMGKKLNEDEIDEAIYWAIIIKILFRIFCTLSVI